MGVDGEGPGAGHSVRDEVSGCADITAVLSGLLWMVRDMDMKPLGPVQFQRPPLTSHARPPGIPTRNMQSPRSDKISFG